MIPPPAMSIIEKNQRPEPGPIKVAKTARAIPTIPYQTARLALSCPDKPPKERIKRIEYWIVGGMGAVLLALLLNMMK